MAHLKVGIPNALLFHHYGGAWTSFLRDLGVEPIHSGDTTGETVLRGAALAENETCLPVKVFAGHLASLVGACDLVLVPRVMGQYPGMKSCPKYLGLPDMSRCLLRDLPPVVSPVMDLSDRRGKWRRDWAALGRHLGAEPRAARRAAARMARSLESGLFQLPPSPLQSPQSLLSPSPHSSRPQSPSTSTGIAVGVAGHLYNVHDAQASLGLLDKVARMGAAPVTVEQVPEKLVRKQLKTVSRKVRWDFESRVVGSVLHWSRTASVVGIIYVNSFACGPGSMIGALIEDELLRERSVPLMTITLDEHSAEGGLITRVEAFVDMLERSTSDASGAGG